MDKNKDIDDEEKKKLLLQNFKDQKEKHKYRNAPYWAFFKSLNDETFWCIVIPLHFHHLVRERRGV